MVRKLAAAATLAWLGLGGSVGAQDSALDAQAAQDTSESDLRCAVWAASLAGAIEDEESSTGLSMAMVWFIARYEGATGTRIEDAMTPDYIKSIGPQGEAIHAECLPRMQEMGDRLTVFGKELQAAGV